MIHFITVTEAVRSFADIIGKVYYRGDEFEIKKGNQIVAHLGPAKNRATIPVSELSIFFAEAPNILPEDLEDFENDLSFIRSVGGEAKNKWD